MFHIIPRNLIREIDVQETGVSGNDTVQEMGIQKIEGIFKKRQSYCNLDFSHPSPEHCQKVTNIESYDKPNIVQHI